MRALAVEIGPRLAGTEGAVRAAEYIRQQLESFGYAVEEQPFAFSSNYYRQVDLAANGEDVPARVVVSSAEGVVSGQLVFAGSGARDEFPTATTGGVAVADRGVVTDDTIVSNATAAGAAALLIVSSDPEHVPASELSGASAIPVVTISQDERDRLRQMAEAAPVTIDLLVAGAAGVTVNVIARDEPGPCETVAGAHYDSVPQSYGASDNATGVATVLEMARAQALRDIPGNQCFVLFGAEELGLFGSAHFVQQLSLAEAEVLVAMLNFDMTGVGDTWWLIGTPSLVAQADAIAERMGFPADPAELPGNTSSDQASFQAAGIDAVMFHRWSDPYLHTPIDTIERVSGHAVVEAARLGLELLVELAGGL